jgi:cytochrome c biogenesis protein
LEPGEVVDLPDNLGSVSFDGLLRFASLDVAYNPGGIWVLGFALLALGSLALSLLIPRRRIWFRFADGKVEAAALARNDDPGLEDFLQRLVLEINKEIEKK